MKRKLFKIVALGIILSAGVLATGCASNNTGKPEVYGLTGTPKEQSESVLPFHGKGPVADNMQQYDRSHQ